VTSSQPAGRAAHEVTQTIPIVTIISGDPVGGGLANSLAKPGGNLTGVTYYATELTGKRLEILKEAVPALGVIGVLALERWKRGHGRSPAQSGLDIGQMVKVQNWGPDLTARVSYRGSTWDAELATPETPKAECMYITAMRGSVLILSDRRLTSA